MIDTIREFLSQPRLAIVGVSHDPKDFSRALFRAFRERNFDVVPVNPSAQEIEGVLCYANMRDIRPPIDTALLMTSPPVTDRVVNDCADAGIRRVWMYRRSPAAVAFCEAHRMTVIAGECPLMYLPQTGWIHRLHGWLHRA